MQGKTEAQLRSEQLKMIVIIMCVLFFALLSYTIFWTIEYDNAHSNYSKTRAEVVARVEEDGVKKKCY